MPDASFLRSSIARASLQIALDKCECHRCRCHVSLVNAYGLDSVQHVIPALLTLSTLLMSHARATASACRLHNHGSVVRTIEQNDNC